ncbi:MAG: glycosyltransferase family 2 protein, partial [Planctomycetota bacterium]
CLIVRDEERMLPGCLASLAGVADRVVVVDTGSSDRTMELARQAGAEVLEFPWCDDFAAARNFSIETVRAGYVLAIDADERLGPGAARALKQVLRRNRLDLGLLPLHDARSLKSTPAEVLSGAERRGESLLLPRLLRRTADLQWSGIIHEQIAGWLSAGRRQVEVVNAPLVHYGAVPELRRERNKDLRNRDLLARHLTVHAGDIVMRSFYARELLRNAQRELAILESTRAWSELLALGTAATRLNVVQPATLQAWLLLDEKRFLDALEVIQAARSLVADHPNLSLLEGAACEQLALMETAAEAQNAWLRRAEVALKHCLGFHGQASVCELLPGATHWAAATRLGTVQLLAARPLQARESFQRALKTKADHLEARLGCIEALIDADLLGPAIAEAQPLLKHDSPDIWLLAAAAVGRMGRTEDLRLFASQTRQALTRAPFAAAHRKLRWREIENILTETALSETPPPAVLH